MDDAVCVRDKDTVIEISYQDMLKYHGRSYVAGVAMAFKLLELALAMLGGREGAARDDIRVVLGVNGPGIIDGIELVTRAATQGRLTVSQQIARDKDAPDAADGQGGKYYFEIACNGRRLCLALKHGLIPPEFIELSNKVHAGTITGREAARLQQLKEEIAVFLLGFPAAALFTVVGEAAPAAD